MQGEVKPKNLWERLGEIDYRWLYALSLVLMVVPILRPFGLPTVVSEPTKGYYKAIVDLPPGSVVAVSFGSSLALLDEQEAQFIATWKVYFQHDLKVIFYCTYADSMIILNEELDKIVKPESYGKAYGVDYVRLPYAPLGESGEAAFATNIRGVYPTDIYGTPLDEIPMMKDINDHTGIDLIHFQYTSCTDVEFVIRQWVVPYGKKAIITTLGCCGPMAAPYYPTQIKGFLSGSGMGTELEVLSGNPGPGAVMSDAKNLGILGLLLFLLLGNISYIGKKFGGKG
jgi:hypothetical protein